MRRIAKSFGALALSISIVAPLRAQQDMGDMKDMKDMPGMDHSMHAMPGMLGPYGMSREASGTA